MGYDVWRTLFTENFDCKKYLYHYTSFEKAIKIIYSEQLWFSSITKTNDTTESKLRIRFVKSDSNESLSNEKTDAVSNFLSRSNESIRLICFSRDIDLTKNELISTTELHKNHLKDRYFDISGRGFALPRMWAQYCSNHEGVCFIINKKNFDKKLSSISYLKQSLVKYQNFLSYYKISEEELEQLYNKVNQHSNGRLSFIDLVNTNKHFVRYNYFIKQKDWENEREYRYVALVDTSVVQSELKISGLYDFVEGIIIGEKMDPASSNVIKKIVEGRCEVKKIHFNANICYVD